MKITSQLRIKVVIILTSALHAVALGLLVWRFSLWPWLIGAMAASHLAIIGVGLWPRSTFFGANLSRLPAAAAARHEIALTIDDGPDPLVTPQVLDILDQFGAKASFFCIGTAATAAPGLCAEITRRGHDIENHTQSHSHNFWRASPWAYKKQIGTAQANLIRLTGKTPKFFRAPAGLRNLFLDAVLRGLNLRLVSWTSRGFDTVTRNPAKVTERLLANLAAGDILLLHDGNAAKTKAGTAVILDVLPPLLTAIRAAGLRCVTLQTATATPFLANSGAHNRSSD